jgi:hypothetical protein
MQFHLEGGRYVQYGGVPLDDLLGGEVPDLSWPAG